MATTRKPRAAKPKAIDPPPPAEPDGFALAGQIVLSRRRVHRLERALAWMAGYVHLDAPGHAAWLAAVSEDLHRQLRGWPALLADETIDKLFPLTDPPAGRAATAGDAVPDPTGTDLAFTDAPMADGHDGYIAQLKGAGAGPEEDAAARDRRRARLTDAPQGMQRVIVPEFPEADR